MNNTEDVQELIREFLRVCQPIEMATLTYHSALLRVRNYDVELVRQDVAGVDRNQVHRECQEKYVNIWRIYEIERQSDDPAVRAHAAANVINAISHALEPEPEKA